MLESIVAGVLNKVLGEYVANLEQKQLKLGIFNGICGHSRASPPLTPFCAGNVVLRNLRLRTDALDKLKLPIDLCEGFLGRLELHIPWANLKTQPVRVEIADLFVLAAPKCEAEVTSAGGGVQWLTSLSPCSTTPSRRSSARSG